MSLFPDLRNACVRYHFLLSMRSIGLLIKATLNSSPSKYYIQQKDFYSIEAN